MATAVLSLFLINPHCALDQHVTIRLLTSTCFSPVLPNTSMYMLAAPGRFPTLNKQKASAASASFATPSSPMVLHTARPSAA